MTTASATHGVAARARRSLLERVLAHTPALALAGAFLIFYAVEAWSRKTPWIFTDEMEWSQISRAIATTGHEARRGQPIGFKSIYAFMIAPFWWIHSTATAYAGIKYLNVVLMTAAAIPTYLLGRMLVSRRGALVAAVLSICIPAMAYVTTIIIEPIAYPYYAFASWLAVRGFASPRRRDAVIGGLAALCGIAVRSPQFLTLPIAFVIAAAGLYLTGPRGRHLRRDWTRGDTVGAIALFAGGLVLFNRVVLQHIEQWQFTTEYYKNRMVDLGLRAALSFTIGLGVVPVVGGLMSLRLPERRGDPVYRAFVAWLAATIFCVGIYTADKAAYLSTNFATLWEERNLIYLAPLLLVGTVLVFSSRRVDWRAGALAAAFVVLIALLKQFQLGWPYFEAPGFVIPALLHLDEGWSVHAERIGVVVLAVASLAVIALRRYRPLVLLVAMLGAAWMLSGEIANTVGIDREASAFRANLPTPLDWVDQATRRQPVTYLGQAIVDANGELLTEFWNRSITAVDSLDGSAPGPGPTYRPLIEDSSGLLSGISTRYVLADDGVTLDARPIAHEGALVLYESSHGWHLLDNAEQVYADGWCPSYCAYTYFKPNQSGTLEVSLSRTAYNGSARAGAVTLTVGGVRINSKNVAVLIAHDRVTTTLRNGTQKTVSLRVTRTPVRVEVTIASSTLIPPSASDPRTLGAQVAFRFVPSGRR